MLQTQEKTGLTALQLEKLCQAEQIERTLYLLFSLNHWAKARERLFYPDRQGLYSVKAAILRQAYTNGLIEARAYIDGIDGFGAELAFDIAAEIAAESLIWRLEEAVDPPALAKRDLSDQIACQFYTQMTGRETFAKHDIEALETEQAREYIIARLQELEQEARLTRQPIAREKLRDLYIAPSDLLCIRDSRYYDLGDWNSWNQLEHNDLRKLDPEGLSLISFHYTGSAAHYVFHTPFRLAETFLATDRLHELRSTPKASRESGEYYGRTITEAESLQYPIANILRELSVDIPAICPRLLEDKEDYTHIREMRSLAWNGEIDFDEDEDELDETFWQEISKPVPENRAQPAKVRFELDTCPICATLLSIPPGLARVEHWQQEHPGQDLTFSQASWVLNLSIKKEQFCQEHPPDYRAPHQQGCGTRYWKIETLGSKLAKNS
jgi:hypothetical protein